MRNVHDRSYADIAAAAEALQPPPPTMLRMDPSALLGDGAVAKGDAKRGRSETADAAARGGWELEARTAAPTKRSKSDGDAKGAMSDSELLAHLNQDLAEAPTGPPRGKGAAGQGAAQSRVNGAAVAGGAAEEAGPRSRWEASDDDDNDGGDGGGGAAKAGGKESETLGASRPRF
jgi:hypothetical protein